MCDPVTATVAVLGAVATNEVVVKPMKEAQKQAKQAQAQQAEAMQQQQQQFETAMEQRESSGAAAETPQEMQRQELAVQEGRRRSRARRMAAGYGSTLLTGGQGVTGQANTAAGALAPAGGTGKTMLGA